MIFADEATTAAVTSANSTATSALVISICTIVIVPITSLLSNKASDGWKQTTEAESIKEKRDAEVLEAKAKIDADVVLAKAKLEADATIAKAKMELDSKLLTLTSQHAECQKDHLELKADYAEVKTKLEECEKQHLISAEDRVRMQGQIDKFSAFMEARIKREKEFGTTPLS